MSHALFLNISDYFLFFVVACSPGSHYNSDNKDCSLCEVGTYQPRPRKGACLPCAPGQVTLGRGATRRQDCCKSHYVMSTCRCCWRLLVAFCGTITACSPNVMCHVTYLLLVLGSLLCFFGFSGFYLFLMKKHPRNLYTDSSFFLYKVSEDIFSILNKIRSKSGPVFILLSLACSVYLLISY